MIRLLVLCGVLLVPYLALGQDRTMSIGLYTGFSGTLALDEGVDRDPRYQAKPKPRWSPIGLHYGIDYEGFGFMIDPGLLRIGHSFNVINTAGGYAGTRDLRLNYFQLPVSAKWHMIDLAFFKVSFVGSVGAAYLLNASETISHERSKLRFPGATYAYIPDSYIIEYDGVIVPELADLEILTTEDFKKYQLFGALGFRSDWDVAQDYRVSFDLRANYSALDSRSDNYIRQASNNERIYDIYGKRHDVFVTLMIGISRTFDYEKKKKAASFKNNGKGRDTNFTKPKVTRPRN